MIEMNEKPFVSVICEYNPFHFGHMYQIQRLKEDFSAVVCILSGNIVQRGSVAVADKYLRARTALNSGANLVLELPVPWCCSSARDFASAGVHIANALGSKYLAFGAEDDIESLSRIKEYISSQPFKDSIDGLMESNKILSYPAALKVVISQGLGAEYGEIIEKPNNILALEYLTAIGNCGIAPVAVKRNREFKSSSSIRGLGNAEDILNSIPESSKAVLLQENGKDFPRDIKRLDPYFIGVLRRMAGQGDIPNGLYSAPEDLVRKIFALSAKVNGVEELVNACADKIYTHARVRRAINAVVFDITSARVKAMPPYTCVLAADEKGRAILKQAKKNQIIDIITKPVHAVASSEATKAAFTFAKGVEDIIALSAAVPTAVDLGKTPFITGG